MPPFLTFRTISQFFAAASLVFLCAAARLSAQLPTPGQAAQLLATRPDLAAMLEQEITNSGLTPDQIRARLRAAGYPETLLDDYLGGRTAGMGRDSLSAVVPTSDMIDAVTALGISDSTGAQQLRQLLRARSRANGDTLSMLDETRGGGAQRVARGRETPRVDSVVVLDSTDMHAVVDSLGRLRMEPARHVVIRGRTGQASDSGYAIFGLDLFSASTTQFDPNLAGPVDASYRLGPGDRLVLIITGDAEKAYTLDVTREGFIVVPGVGEVAAANLTLGELDAVLLPKLAHVYSGLGRGAAATTHFSLNVAQLHTNQIVVAGDVEQPASYRISSAGTAFSALYAAGGPTTTGSLRRIEIRRGGRLVDTLDLYDYLLHGDASHDPRLQSGDVVFVPVHGPRARVYGEVVRPGTYELRYGETLTDLLRAAGGFTAEAARRRVQITRILPAARDTSDQARVVIDISAAQFAGGMGPAYPLEAGDVVRVFPVSQRVANQVVVRGDVWTPGTVGLAPGMHLSDALRMAGGLKPDAYLDQVLVSRLRPADSARVELRTALQDSAGRPIDDLILHDDDEIRVFALAEFRDPVYVAIAGAVHRPGRYAYREGMTLRDLVLLAGGPDQRAELEDAEIARWPASRAGGRLAVSTRVPIDSSYAVGVESAARYVASRTADVLPKRTAPEVPLEPYDNVLILAQTDWEDAQQVTVTGEVRFPGTYTLLSKGERLSDVLRRAGGLTPSAYADGVVFYRHAGRTGRVGIDLPRVLRDSMDRDNLLLEDGDSIALPRFSGLVQVDGAVNAPRGVAYTPGADLIYYVRAAGGPSQRAALDHAYVTQPDGRVESVVTRSFWPDAVPVPRAGSVIVVPQADARLPSADGAKWPLIAQIVGSLVTLAVVLRN